METWEDGGERGIYDRQDKIQTSRIWIHEYQIMLLGEKFIKNLDEN